MTGHVHDNQQKYEQTYENHTQITYQMQFLQKIQDEKTEGIKKQHNFQQEKIRVKFLQSGTHSARQEPDYQTVPTIT